MTEESERDPFAFVDTLSPMTRKFFLDWIVSPWTLQEMLEGEPDSAKAATIVEELKAAGVLCCVDGMILWNV